MIHVYSLVHDDMPCMDDDELRRGKPTVHVKYDEATALLVGDALQSQAFVVLTSDVLGEPQQASLVRELALASGSIGMCGGQAIDLASVGHTLTRPQLETMHRMKTGALLRAAVRMGALAGETPDAQALASLDAYAAAVGLAFQVVDDILDVTTDSAPQRSARPPARTRRTASRPTCRLSGSTRRARSRRNCAATLTPRLHRSALAHSVLPNWPTWW
ncbi:geranylgeranyl pyrophosphate synthase [Paraburkholderia youngii]